MYEISREKKIGERNGRMIFFVYLSPPEPHHPLLIRPCERHLSIECQGVRAHEEPAHTCQLYLISLARVTDPPRFSDSRFNVSALLCLGLTVPCGRLSTSRVRNTEILASYSRETGAIPRES